MISIWMNRSCRSNYEQFHRLNDIKKHPKFPNKKRVLDLTNYDSKDDSDDESDLFKEINIIDEKKSGNKKKCKDFNSNIFSIIDC